MKWKEGSFERREKEERRVKDEVGDGNKEEGRAAEKSVC